MTTGTGRKRRQYWAHPTAMINPAAQIGAGTKIWQHSQVLAGAIIGQECIIGHNCTVWGRAVLGDQVTLESNIDVWPAVTIEAGAFLGPSAVLTNDLTPRAFHKKGGVYVPTLIQRGAAIGANATIICGHTIGAYAVVGAGSVVSKNVSAYAKVVGNPARRIGWVCRDNRWTNLDFSIQAQVICPHCGLIYRLENNLVVEIDPNQSPAEAP